jgi:hypothetical protein
MDWIERWLGISPDNGDGSLEVLLVLVCPSVLSLVAIGVSPRSRRLVARYLAGVVNGTGTAQRRVK